MTTRENAVREAEETLKHTKIQAKAKDATADGDRQAKKSVYDQELSKYKDIEEEIKKCKLFCAKSGMVVYYVSEQSRSGFGSQQSIVSQGEPVREGQKLIRIPNLKKMLVNTKVHEAMVSRIRGEERDANNKVIYRGQPALVRVDAYPDKVMKVHVKSVATVASQQNFLSSDVQLYQTMVAIDEPLKGLKPGMTGEVTIVVDNSLEHVLTVPLQAIIGTPAMGATRKCFVLTADGPIEGEIVLGMSNQRMAEVRSGLEEGEEVVLNPAKLVGDKEKVRQPGALNNAEGAGEGGQEKSAPGGISPTNKPAPAGASPKEPGAVPAGKGPAATDSQGGGRPKMSPEDRAKRQKEMTDRFRKATPEQRKDMLEQIPESFRKTAKDRLKAQGIDIPD